MQISLIAVGNRMPDWVQSGYAEYARRMPPEIRIGLKEIGAEHRQKNTSVERIVKKEGARMLAAIPRASHIVALDMNGTPWSTEQLSAALSRWYAEHRHVSLLIGGPDGLAEECRSRANESWSMSRLTFPHSLIRIMAAEQLYRAWTLLCNHPYHR